MLELQETLEKLELRATELGHLGAALRTAQHGDERDDQDLAEVVPHVLGTRIGNAVERGDRRQERSRLAGHRDRT